MIFSSSYSLPEAQGLITAFVRAINPKKAVEIGTQQGMSSILIGGAMQYGSQLITYDLFEDKYQGPPHLPTHANKEIAEQNIKKAGVADRVTVKMGSHREAFDNEIDIYGVGYTCIDLLHVDICNHYDNLKPILELLENFTSKAIILEGGIYNLWQMKHGYKPWAPLLHEVLDRWQHITVPFNEHNAVTLLTRIPNDPIIQD